MIVHTIVHNSLDDFAKTVINEQEPIVGYYLELHKNGNVRGSYITDKRYPAICTYDVIHQHGAKLTQENNRIWINIPIELYMEKYNNFIIKECNKMHKKWESVPYDDLYQMFGEALVKCFNKGGYILNSRLILRTFYNIVYTFIRHNYNDMINTTSIDEPIGTCDDEEISIADMIEDEHTPETLMNEKILEQEKIDQLNLIRQTLKSLGYSDRIYKNILFELEKHAQSRSTRTIIEKVKERLQRDAWI